MKCTCGYETPAELAAQNEGRCASCGSPAQPDAIELLSRPELGLVAELRPGQVEYARAFEEMLDEMDETVAAWEHPLASPRFPLLTSVRIC